MAPRYDFSIDQGATVNIPITLADSTNTGIDLTNAVLKCAAKTSYSAASASFSFVISVPTPTNGQFFLTMPASSSAALTAGTYDYDCEYINGSTALRLFEGTLTVRPGVTL